MAVAETNGSVRWQTMAAVATVVILAAGAVVQFGSLSSQVASTATANQELRQQVHDLDQKLSDSRSEIVSIKMALKEIETQFCAQADAVNLLHATDLRLIASLWHKVFSQVYPTDNPYYPSIGHCK